MRKIMSSNGTYGMLTSLQWACSMVHISWCIIYCKHNNLEWSIQLRMIWDRIFWYWTRNHEYCVSSFFVEYSEGCYLLRRASNYVGFCLHIWFLLNLVLVSWCRWPLLCYFKLCASFRSHWWIQTWVTVRKRPIWVKINNLFSCVTLKFDGWPSKTIGHLS